jgi:hypothetical protein
VKLTVPHWYGFAAGFQTSNAAVLTGDDWDRLREVDSAFGFGRSREEWVAKARSSSELTERAKAIAILLDGWNTRRLVSPGVGTGLMEFLLKSERPGLVMRCGDWSPESLRLLRERFTECDSIEEIDLRGHGWARDPDEVVLLNRVDMELSDREWRSVFTGLARAQVERVVLVPCGLLTGSMAVAELRGLVVSLGRRRSIARSGYLRTPARMLDLFDGLYERREVLSTGNLPTWGLHLAPGGPQSPTR